MQNSGLSSKELPSAAIRWFKTTIPARMDRLHGIVAQIVLPALPDSNYQLHVHHLWVQIDFTVILVLFSVESHLVSSFVAVCCFSPRRLVRRVEEALHSIKTGNRAKLRGPPGYRHR